MHSRPTHAGGDRCRYGCRGYDRRDEILHAHPDLEPQDIREALLYAAEAVKERALPLKTA